MAVTNNDQWKEAELISERIKIILQNADGLIDFNIVVDGGEDRAATINYSITETLTKG